MNNCPFLIVGLVEIADMARFVWGRACLRAHGHTRVRDEGGNLIEGGQFRTERPLKSKRAKKWRKLWSFMLKWQESADFIVLFACCVVEAPAFC